MKKIFFVLALLLLSQSFLIESSEQQKINEDKINLIIKEFPTKELRRKLRKFISQRRNTFFQKQAKLRDEASKSTNATSEMVTILDDISDNYWSEKFNKEFGDNDFAKFILSANSNELLTFDLLVLDSRPKTEKKFFR